MSPQKCRGRRLTLITATVLVVVLSCAASFVVYRWVYWFRYADFGSLRERDRIEVGVKMPRDLAVSRSGDRLYVIDETQAGQSSLHVLDTAAKSLKATIPLGPGFPVTMAITPDGRYALVTVSQYRGGAGGGIAGENRLAIIDTTSNAIAGAVRIPGQSVSGIAVTRDGTSAYVSDRVAGNVFRVDLDKQLLGSSIDLPRGPYAIAMKPDSDLAYVVSTRIGKTNQISVVDTRNDRIIATIQTELNRSTSECRAVFTPDARRLYVANGKDSRLCVVDTDPESPTFHTQLEMIETEGGAIFGLALNPTGTLALVLKGDDQILVVDTNVESWTYHQVVGRVKVGGLPLKLFAHTTTSGRTAVYVGDREDGQVRVLGAGED